MRPLKGDRLYVNMGASQVRRRLKGHGFGVRKVESAGKNRALIIHTATGRHREELHALFADAIEPAPADDETMPRSNQSRNGTSFAPQRGD